ncbi:hypothetical protein GCM10020295_06950 [Streptomyces cinereospinus]
MRRASTRQSVTIAVSFGRSASSTSEGSSSRVSGSVAGSRPRISYHSPDQLAWSVSRFHSALPTRLSSDSPRAAGGAAVTGPACAAEVTGEGAVAQLCQMRVQVVELVQGEVAQGALPAVLRVRSVSLGVPPYGVHLALEPPRLRYQRVHRAASGRLGGGAVRGQMGRHDALRCGTVRRWDRYDCCTARDAL